MQYIQLQGQVASTLDTPVSGAYNLFVDQSDNIIKIKNVSGETYSTSDLIDKSAFTTTSSFNSFTSSYLADSSSFASRIENATNEQDLSYLATTGSNTFNGSQSINGDQIINGFVSASAGVYANVINPLPGSDTINLTAANTTGDILTVNLLVVTGSVSGDAFQRIATTGSNQFNGNQSITGSVYLDGTNAVYFGGANGGYISNNAEGSILINDPNGYIQLDAQSPTEYSQIILNANNYEFFSVSDSNSDTSIHFTKSGSLLLNGISYDAHLATTGSNTFNGAQIITGSIHVSQALKLEQNNPLPAGEVGMLAVSESKLWFYNGSWNQVV